MKYDFTTVANRRNIGAGKWELMLEKNPNVAEGVIPYSVADMEFYNAPELMNGLAKYAMQPIYGYTSPMDTYYNAVINYMKKYHNWEIQKDWICPTSGVVGALNDLVRTLTEPGDGVVIMRPVYYPFSSAITRNNRNLVNVPLINNNGRYEIDFEAFDQATKPEEVKMFILCSPHNPIGRVWTKDELRKMGDIC